jgi:muconolactone delta-isomerase
MSEERIQIKIAQCRERCRCREVWNETAKWDNVSLVTFELNINKRAVLSGLPLRRSTRL